MAAQQIVKKRIGELLIASGKITEQDLQAALDKQKGSDKKIGEILVDMGMVEEEDLIVNLANQYQIPFIKIENYQIEPETLELFPKGLAKKYGCIPLDKIGDIISLVISDPGNLYDLKQQEDFLNCKIQFFVTTPSTLEEAIKQYYG
jgi:type IV pilus assembly protein PilB